MNLAFSQQFAILLFAVVGVFLLTVLVYRRDKRDAINIIFTWLGLVTSVWLVVMFVSMQPVFVIYSLWLIRSTIFLATPLSLLFFLLGYALAHPGEALPRRVVTLTLVPTCIVMVLAFTPLIFSQVEIVAGAPRPVPGPGIAIFSLLSTFFSLGAVYVLLKRLHHAVDAERRQLWFVLIGLFFMLGLIIVTILLPAVLFHDNSFVLFAPLYVLIFLVMTAVAILRYHLFDVKIIATEALVTILILVLLFEGLLSGSLVTIMFKTSFAILVGILGIILVRSVKHEVAQREELAVLAKSLEEANARLKELDQQKTDFLSIAAHQLRTPLSILNGYIELIKDGAYGKVHKETKEILHNMDESNTRLVKLVDEFLDITRIEQGRTKFDFILKNINDTIESVRKELVDRAAQKSLQLVWQSDAAVKPIFMDEEKIRHVIFNFIDNAIKYSDQGKIMVTAQREDNGVAVRVRDHGFGFGRDDTDKFFQKFYRGNNVKGRDVSGTGLGLYVCRKFIEAHEGKVWAKSAGLGKGSEFGFWIPLKSKNNSVVDK